MGNTDVKQNSKGFVVGGYTFETKEEADAAKEELEAIKYLSSKADYNDIGQVYRLYNNILDKQLFRSPVGMDYIKKLQQQLYKSKAVPNGQIRPIPINVETQQAMDDRREALSSRGKVKELQREVFMYKSRFNKSVIINVALVIIIIVMIAITATSSNPNILNYETKLQDKYASWQEELDRRQKVIEQKEKELHISDNNMK